MHEDILRSIFESKEFDMAVADDDTVEKMEPAEKTYNEPIVAFTEKFFNKIGFDKVAATKQSNGFIIKTSIPKDSTEDVKKVCDTFCAMLYTNFPEISGWAVVQGSDIDINIVIKPKKTQVSESSSTTIDNNVEIEKIGVGIVVPQYVVNLFGEKSFTDAGAITLKNRGYEYGVKTVMYHQLSGISDIKRFFQSNHDYLSDTMGELKELVEKLNDGAEDSNKLDVEIETVIDDVEEILFAIK